MSRCRSDVELLRVLQGPDPEGALGPWLQRFRGRPSGATSALRQLPPGAAQRLLRLLRRGQVQLDIFHVNAALDVCAKGGAWASALGASWAGWAGLRLDVVSFGSLASACASRGRWADAFEVLAEMRRERHLPNLIICNSALHSCAFELRWRQALGLRRSMVHAGMSPNDVSSSSLVSACEGRWPLALRLLEDGASLFEQNGVISACEKGGRWEVALDLLHTMHVADTVSFSSAMAACGRRGKWRLAVALLAQMAAARAEPNDVSFNSAVAACEEEGAWEAALGLLRELAARRLLDVVSFGSAITTCEVAQQWQKALWLLASMDTWQLAPSVPCLGAALRAAVRGGWRAAAGLFQRLARTRAALDVPSYETLAKSCEREAQFGWLLEVLGDCEMPLGLLASACAQRFTGTSLSRWQVAMSAVEPDEHRILLLSRKAQSAWQVPQTLYVEKLVEVPKVQMVDVMKQVSKPMVKQVTKQVVKPIYEVVEKIVEVPITTIQESRLWRCPRWSTWSWSAKCRGPRSRRWRSRWRSR
ncbi:unnamed protein product [Effrenium voratum]|nr:unnamed protein product [Effrenium voratum]